MRHRNSPLFVIVLVVCSLTYRTESRADDRCFVCHESLGDKASALFKSDIHHARGVTCAGCHGGNPDAEEMERAMDKNAGFLGVPHGDDISARCARCHSNARTMAQYNPSLPLRQFEQLQTSVHGKSSTKAKEHIAQCTTCHGAHGVAAVRDPRSAVHPLNIVRTCSKCHSDAKFMRTYNPSLPVDQREKYLTSVHGQRNAKGDAKTAVCANCHGSHNILPASDVKSKVYPTNLPGTCAGCHASATYMSGYSIPTDQYDKYAKSVHGVALLQKHDLGAPACNNCHGNHGATPPGVESISKVCGTCHALNADLFSGSPHKKAFDDLQKPECETCHGNHAIMTATKEMLGVTGSAVCSSCHSDTNRQKGYEVAGAMRLLIDSMEVAEGQARGLVEEAEQKGMEISEAKFKLRDVRQSRLETRTVVHAFNEGRFREVAGKGLAGSATVTEEAKAAIGEYYFRRWGLGIATLIISVLAVALYVYIRRLERSSPG
jgi:predicted CXXCH cytochrome family protein